MGKNFFGTEKKLKILALLSISSLFSAFYLIRRGFYEPHDLHHIADIYQMARALETGHIPPRWSPDFLFGYGYPLFNFYYVFPFYLGALFFLAGLSLTLSFKLVFLIAIGLSVIGMYLLLREFFSEKASIAGSLLFLYTPYRAVQIYVRGAMGEAFALSLLPIAIWVIVRLIKKPTKKLKIAATLIFACFFLSHNYLWFLSLPYAGLFIYAVFFKEKDRLKKSLKNIALPLILSFGLTAYWFIPAVFERKYIDKLTPFLLEDHFPFIKQLVLPSWGYGSSVWGPGDEISFQVGIINILVFLIVVVFLLYRKNFLKGKYLYIALWGVVGMLLTLFMMNIRSLFVWKLIPIYDFIQFPWRLLIFTTFITSVLAALVVDVFKKKGFNFVWLIIVAGSIIATVGYFRPSAIVMKKDNEYLSRFFADRTVQGQKDKVSEEYYMYSEDYLLLPNWVPEKPKSLPETRVVMEKEKGEVVKIKTGTYYTYFEADVLSPSTVITVNTLYFPGWKAYSNGYELTTGPSKEGYINLKLEEGSHRVYVQLFDTPVRRVSNIMSLISLTVLMLWMLDFKKIRRLS